MAFAPKNVIGDVQKCEQTLVDKSPAGKRFDHNFRHFRGINYQFFENEGLVEPIFLKPA
tara:strand:+ start:223 stop:399 length:177 start_codon:yes stop_codon:yes gene_type:complete